MYQVTATSQLVANSFIFIPLIKLYIVLEYDMFYVLQLFQNMSCFRIYYYSLSLVLVIQSECKNVHLFNIVDLPWSTNFQLEEFISLSKFSRILQCDSYLRYFTMPTSIMDFFVLQLDVFKQNILVDWTPTATYLSLFQCWLHTTKQLDTCWLLNCLARKLKSSYIDIVVASSSCPYVLYKHASFSQLYHIQGDHPNEEGKTSRTKKFCLQLHAKVFVFGYGIRSSSFISLDRRAKSNYNLYIPLIINIANGVRSAWILLVALCTFILQRVFEGPCRSFHVSLCQMLEIFLYFAICINWYVSKYQLFKLILSQVFVCVRHASYEQYVTVSLSLYHCQMRGWLYARVNFAVSFFIFPSLESTFPFFISQMPGEIPMLRTFLAKFSSFAYISLKIGYFELGDDYDVTVTSYFGLNEKKPLAILRYQLDISSQHRRSQPPPPV